MNQEYMVITNNGNKIFFVNEAFKSAYTKAQTFIKNHNKPCKLYWKNINSQYNFGWKFVGSYNN